MDTLSELLSVQSGVVTRRQLLTEAGLGPNDVRRMLRRGALVKAAGGVYIDHNGELTWIQRSWVAVLSMWPAALSRTSAIRAANGPGRREPDDGPLHIAVDRTRSIEQPPGLRLHRLADLESKVQWNRSPPRVRIEHAVLDVAAEAPSDFECISRLADMVQARLTTAARIEEALGSRTRIGRRGFMADILDDIGNGTCSVLEHGYLCRVERPHGLPTAQRQVRSSSPGPIYRDVEYADQGLEVELDGRLFHNTAKARDSDLDRDLDAAVDGRTTVRLGWGQVFERSCLTAARVGRLLEARGWPGPVLPCPKCAPPAQPRSGVSA